MNKSTQTQFDAIHEEINTLSSGTQTQLNAIHDSEAQTQYENITDVIDVIHVW